MRATTRPWSARLACALLVLAACSETTTSDHDDPVGPWEAGFRDDSRAPVSTDADVHQDGSDSVAAVPGLDARTADGPAGVADAWPPEASREGGTAFAHPGLLLAASDIARIKKKLSAKEEPWFSSYQVLAADGASSATKGFSAPSEIIGRNAASAYASTRYGAEAAAVLAFQNALVFVLSGDPAHAAKTVEVLNAYAATTAHFDKADPERDLEAAILGWLWVSAAELIRSSDYSGWATADRRRFDAWIRGVVYDDHDYASGGVLVTPLVNGAGARGAFGLRTKMAIGVYLDDMTIYRAAVDYFFHGQGNGAPQYYVDVDTGQTWESGRDQGHAQGGLSRLIETAQIAANQGDASLYAWQNHALLRAIEYIAQYNLGNDVPYRAMQPYTLDWAAVYNTISDVDRGKFATIYELPYGYFHDTLGMDAPFAKQAIAKEGVESFSPLGDNPMFATLSYRR